MCLQRLNSRPSQPSVGLIGLRTSGQTRLSMYFGGRALSLAWALPAQLRLAIITNCYRFIVRHDLGTLQGARPTRRCRGRRESLCQHTYRLHRRKYTRQHVSSWDHPRSCHLGKFGNLPRLANCPGTSPMRSRALGVAPRCSGRIGLRALSPRSHRPGHRHLDRRRERQSWLASAKSHDPSGREWSCLLERHIPIPLKSANGNSNL